MRQIGRRSGFHFLLNYLFSVSNSFSQNSLPVSVSASYIAATTIETGKGYWLFISEPAAAVVQGDPVLRFTRHLTRGWHLLGSVLDSVSFTNPEDNPDGAVLLPAFGWKTNEQLYFRTRTNEQTYGYWIAVAQECDLTLSARQIAGTPTISWSETSTQSFYKSNGTSPPPPPGLPSWVPISKHLERPTLLQKYPNPFNLSKDSSWTLPMRVRIGTLEIPLYLGVRSSATDRFDANIDTLAPPPPFTGYSVLMISEFPNSLQADYRAPSTRISWMINIANTSGDSGVVTWQDDDFPESGTVFLNQAVDMSLQTSFDFAGDQTMLIVHSFPVSVEYREPTPNPNSYEFEVSCAHLISRLPLP